MWFPVEWSRQYQSGVSGEERHTAATACREHLFLQCFSEAWGWLSCVNSTQGKEPKSCLGLLGTGIASPLLPVFPILEEQGYFPLCSKGHQPPLQASSGVHNSSPISMTVVTINIIVLGKKMYSFQIFFLTHAICWKNCGSSKSPQDPCILCYIFKATYKVKNLQKNNRNSYGHRISICLHFPWTLLLLLCQ